MHSTTEDKDKTRILNEVILAYRRLIDDRYDYKNLKIRTDLPKSYTSERAAIFKNYFLNYTYPLPEKRELLNQAFLSLDSYIKHPETLLRLLFDSRKLLLKYGRQLPEILKAGLNALRAFRRTNKFEESLAEQAISSKLKMPFSNEEIEELIKTLSHKEIENFIENVQRLFNILRDSVLTSKIINIIDSLIKIMKNRSEVYSTDQINGLEIGKEIIIAGDKLFDQLGKDDQLEIFNFIVKMEREILNMTTSK